MSESCCPCGWQALGVVGLLKGGQAGGVVVLQVAEGLLGTIGAEGGRQGEE